MFVFFKDQKWTAKSFVPYQREVENRMLSKRCVKESDKCLLTEGAVHNNVSNSVRAPCTRGRRPWGWGLLSLL